MANAVLMALTLAITGLIFAIVINVVGNRQDRQAKKR
jgi:hypothetical protein